MVYDCCQCEKYNNEKIHFQKQQRNSLSLLRAESSLSSLTAHSELRIAWKNLSALPESLSFKLSKIAKLLSCTDG